MFLTLNLFGCSKQKNTSAISTDKLKEGDLVFRKGNSVKTQAVLHADRTGVYSHVGIVVQYNDSLKIIHITPGERADNETVDKIKMESIEAFFSKERAEKGAIMRFADSVDCSKAAALQAIYLYKQGILFDHDYNLDDSVKMYCTEFVWHAYRAGGRDITNNQRSVIVNFLNYSGTYILPSNIYKNEHLVTIYKF